MLGTYSSPARTSGDDFLARLPRRSQHDRTHLERWLLHIRQRDVRFKRAHAAGLVFAHHKLQVIFPRRQVEARGVLDILLPRLQGRVEIELDRLARAADRPLHLVNHFANNVERSLVFVAALHKGNLRARHDQRNRHEEAILIQAEVHRVEIDGHVGRRQVARPVALPDPARDLRALNA